MASDVFPSSTIELSPLQDAQTSSLLDIRPWLEQLQGRNADTLSTILTQVQQAFDNIQNTLRSSSPSLQRVSIGAADIEDLTVSGQYGPGVFKVLNGLPNYDQIGWIGSQSSLIAIASITAGLITTADAHHLIVGDHVLLENTTDVANSATYVVATTPLPTTFTVTGLTGGNSTGGDAIKYAVVTSIVAGLVTTDAAHGLKPRDNVFIESTTDPLNTGFYVVATTPLATTFTVTGGVVGGDSTGGDVVKQFQGGWLKMISIGGSQVSNAHFVADVDGSLSITDALITLTGSGATVVLDPTTGKITVTQAGGGRRVTIGGLGLVIDDSTGLPTWSITATPGGLQLNSGDANAYQINLTTTGGESIYAPTTTFGLSKLIDLYGYSGGSGFGPLVSCTQLRGTGQTATATQPGDTLGGLIAFGFDGTGESNYVTGIRGVATQAHGATAHGGKLVFEITPNGTQTPSVAVTIDHNGNAGFGGNATPGYAVDASGDINASGVFRVGGGAGITGTQPVGISLTVSTGPIEYLDWSNSPQTAWVVTTVTLNTSARAYTGGIRTT